MSLCVQGAAHRYYGPLLLWGEVSELRRAEPQHPSGFIWVTEADHFLCVCACVNFMTLTHMCPDSAVCILNSAPHLGHLFIGEDGEPGGTHSFNSRSIIANN